ncbi:sigma-70 family RNA polymerase sigma factor [Pediococcus acidilactici]
MQQVDLLDEAKIIAEVKVDDTHNFERLFNKYHPIIKKMRQKYTIRSFDWADWMQEGRIVFFNSVVNYDADLKIKLGAFFKNNFRNRIFSILRFEMAYKRKAGFAAQSLEELEEEAEVLGQQVSRITPQNQLMVKETYAEYETLLSPFEKEVSVLLFQGLRPDQIAERLGYDVAKIQNALLRCKQKLSRQLYGQR